MTGRLLMSVCYRRMLSSRNPVRERNRQSDNNLDRRYYILLCINLNCLTDLYTVCRTQSSSPVRERNRQSDNNLDRRYYILLCINLNFLI